MRVAFVVDRYGSAVLGGAERQTQALAEWLAQNTAEEITVLTTTNLSHEAWRDDLPAGTTIENGVTIHRFPISAWHGQKERDALNALALYQWPNQAKQREWIQAGMHSYALYSYLLAAEASYDWIITTPYLSTLAYYASCIAPHKTILIPCLHREQYAYYRPFIELLNWVEGALFYSPEEEEFAIKVLRGRPRYHAVLGAMVSAVLLAALPSPAYGALLYLGRLSAAKNLSLLYQYADRYHADHPDFRLLVVGKGEQIPPNRLPFVYEGSADESKKTSLLRGCLALCQPSLNESFSLVLMEAWQQKRPVLVHGLCSVTRGHVQRSGGGLWFNNYHQFSQAISRFTLDPVGAREMGEKGFDYVQEQYQPDKVGAKLQLILQTWRENRVAMNERA